MGRGKGDNFAKPGDLLCAEVPEPGRVFSFARGDSVRSMTGAGVPPNKTTLQLRRCSHKTSGTSLRVHIQKILADPQRWKMAMGERLMSTAAWATAFHLTPVGNAAPPRPISFESVTSLITRSGPIDTARRRAS